MNTTHRHSDALSGLVLETHSLRRQVGQMIRVQRTVSAPADLDVFSDHALEYLAVVQDEYILRLKLEYAFQELELIRQIMNVYDQLAVFQSLFYLLDEDVEIDPCPADDRDVRTELELPDVHNGLLNLMYVCRLNIESTYALQIFRFRRG